MRGARRGWRAAALGGAAAALLLLLPLRLPPEGPAWRAIGGSIHVGLFAGLAWLIGRLLPPTRRGWFLWGGLAVFAAATEGLQPFVGRSAEWTDGLYGLAGAAILCGTWRWRARFRWAGVLALCLFPPVWELAMVRMETKAFPVLAQPTALWAGRGWSLNGVELAASEQKGFTLRPASRDGEFSYPGIFREATRSDWRGMRSLTADLFWPAPVPAVFAVRVDDRSGNPSYADRFQREFTATQGWNRVRIPVEEIGRTAGGRSLQLDRIRQWGVFLVSDVPFDYFSIGTVRLDLQEEQP